MYIPKNRSAKDRRPKLTELKGETDYFTILVENFNTPLSKLKRTRPKSKQKNNQDREDLKNIINYFGLIDSYKDSIPKNWRIHILQSQKTKLAKVLATSITFKGLILKYKVLHI